MKEPDTITTALGGSLRKGDIITFKGVPTRWQRFKLYLRLMVKQRTFWPVKPSLRQFVITSVGSQNSYGLSPDDY